MNNTRRYILSALAISISPSALAVQGVCPEINGYTDAGVKIVNSTSPLHSYGQTIYFCKQDFSAASLSYLPSTTDLLTGGNQHISQGSIQQSSPILSSINLSGFTPASLNLNTLSANFPNSNGVYDSPSLFNFFTRIPGNYNCDNYNGQNQYTFIKNYLRTNASIFQNSVSGIQTGVADTGSNNSIAKINNALLLNTASNKTLPSLIELYYANPFSGQFYSRGNDRYCWVGVGTKLTINSNTANLSTAGDYKATLAVQTYN